MITLPSTFVDNFGNEFIAPYIPNKIVGFAGIDPAPASIAAATNSVNSDGTISETYTTGHVGSNGSSGGDYSLDHEELDNLLGGEDFEHYHLNEADYEAIIALLDEKRAAEENGESYYNLNEDEYERFLQLLDDYYPEGSNGEELSRYTLNEAEYEKLHALLEAVYPDEDTTEPVFQNSIDDTALNELVDARVNEALSDNPLINNEESLTAFIDARIETYLRNINASIHSGLDGN